jgi:hypothetical protein
MQTVSLWGSSLVVMVAMWLGSRADESERARITEFYHSLSRPAVPAPVANLPEPFFISGLVLLVLGLVLAALGALAGGASVLAAAVGLALAALGGALILRHRRNVARDPLRTAAGAPPRT